MPMDMAAACAHALHDLADGFAVAFGRSHKIVKMVLQSQSCYLEGVFQAAEYSLRNNIACGQSSIIKRNLEELLTHGHTPVTVWLKMDRWHAPRRFFPA